MKILTIDTEATGTDPKSDRLLTIFCGIMNEDKSWGETHNVMFNPGVDISEEAVSIHGISKEKAAAEGLSGEAALAKWVELRRFVVNSLRDSSIPVVAYNAAYDLTLVNAELERVGLKRISWDDFFVMDPLVIDRQVDKYRKGKRQLVETARVHGVVVDESEAHDASYDCFLTGSIVFSPKFLNSLRVLKMSHSELHENQKKWRYAQCLSLQSHLRVKNNDPDLFINPEWPEYL